MLQRSEKGLSWPTLAIVTAILGLLVAFTFGCDTAESLKDQLTGQVPNPDVVSAEAVPEIRESGHFVTVKCTCQNNGKSGYVKVTAELHGNGSWEESERVQLDEGETKVVEIEFSNVELTDAGGGQYEYNSSCSAEPDKNPSKPAE